MDASSELEHADEEEDKYLAPLMKNTSPLPVLPLCCQGNTLTTCPALQEIEEESRGPIVNDLDVSGVQLLLTDD